MEDWSVAVGVQTDELCFDIDQMIRLMELPGVVVPLGHEHDGSYGYMFTVTAERAEAAQQTAETYIVDLHTILGLRCQLLGTVVHPKSEEPTPAPELSRELIGTELVAEVTAVLSQLAETHDLYLSDWQPELRCWCGPVRIGFGLAGGDVQVVVQHGNRADVRPAELVLAEPSALWALIGQFFIGVSFESQT